MKSLTRLWPLAALLLATLPLPAAAQNVTTGSLSGVVTDAQGGALPGATVTAVHTPTGSSYEGVTQADGRFSILNVRVGGPYELTINMPGFRTQTIGNVSVSLGEGSELPVTMQLETLTETVQVTAESSPVFSGSKAGTTATVTSDVIQNLPTIARSLQDFARVNPFFSQTATNANPSALSVAGRSGRYNNLQIDGAVNNDLFGLADSATPGGQANTQPISLDAIGELQLVVSSYDVRQGGFSGGGINAITRSGSNAFHGTGYYYFRDQDWVGDGVDDRPIATFSDKQIGASLSGPLARNRAFFFGNVDFQRRETPSGFSIDGSSGQRFGREAETQQVLSILQNRYGYNPGAGFEEFIRENPNDKVFVRGDVNLGQHQLVVRHNYIDGYDDVGTQSATTYLFPDQFYRFNSQTNSTVGQLNSTFGSMFNEFRLTYQRVRDKRTNSGQPFPHVRVVLGGNQAIRFGTEQFSAANELDQDIVEINNDLTMVRGKHQFTFGTHNELFSFRNLFIRDVFGFYDFPSIAAFDQGLAGSYSLSFSNTSDPRQAADFSVYQLGFYAGDQWRLADRFTLTYGLRVDFPIFPDTPSANPTVQQLYGQRTDVTPETQTWSPRAGFNYDMSGAARQQLRGGVGIFGGRTPYVWLSNQYTNTGSEFTRITASGSIPFVADPNSQPRQVGSASTNEINLIDSAYDFPQLIRGNIAYDRQLPFQGLIATGEVIFSSTLKDIDYRNLNLVQTSTRPDGRPVYGRVNSTFSDVVFLTNTDQGSPWSFATKLERPFRNGWYASASYLYGRSETVNDGGSSQARSNWVNQQNQGDPNAVPLGISNFDPGHRITLAGSYQLDFRRARVTLSAFYNGQTGRPYGYAFGNDANGDGLGITNTNDLLYIPRDANDVIVNGGTFQQLQDFLVAGDCSNLPTGGIMERNTCRAPWTNNLDFRAAVDVPVSRLDAEITLDILNLVNLFSSDSGLIEYATFNGLLPVNFGGVDAATNRYIYTLNTVAQPGSARFSRDDLRSRWQAQLGLRVRF
jgi:hypothetical protein